MSVHHVANSLVPFTINLGLVVVGSGAGLCAGSR